MPLYMYQAAYVADSWAAQLKKPQNAPSETRFKLWWRMVGSAIENAAKLVDDKSAPKFKDLFLANEEEDTESMSLGEALKLMADKWRDEEKEKDFGVSPKGTTLVHYFRFTNGVEEDEAMVGAGAVVTKDIPSGSVAAGNPARVIVKNTRADKEVVSKTS
jgi:hypothetical protein